jgi:broad specificity phosphatase PhoE
MTAPRVLLVRHPPVPVRFRGLCYGASDIALDDEGLSAAAELAARVIAHLADTPPATLVHSGLDRCAQVASRLAQAWSIPARVDVRLRERDFGEWELQSWDDIHARTGDAMNGMLTDPARWHPPGGETTFQMRDRVLDWHASLPRTDCIIVAITHGGPIAALLGTLRGLPVAAWPPLIPAPGTWVATS